MANLVTRFIEAWKALGSGGSGNLLGGRGGSSSNPSFPTGSSDWYSGLNSPRTNINYEREVGRPEDNSIVGACFGWLVDAWGEAPIYVSQFSETGTDKAIPKHAMAELIRHPNPWYGDQILWHATLSDLKLTDGNAYWHILKNSAGMPVQMYWMASNLVEPRWDQGDPSSFISHYEYKPDGKVIRLEVDEVIHFREGIHPSNQRKGYCRLKAGLREIFTDSEAGNTVSLMLRNRGQLGLSISPKPGKDGTPVSLREEDAKLLEAKLSVKTSGDQRGKPVVHSIPVDIVEFGTGLAELATRDIRKIPEERICALFRIPPGVVKMGAGLDRNTMANAKTEQEQAWRNAIMPLHRTLLDVIDQKLLPMFEAKPEGFAVKADYSDVPALQADQDLLAKRLAMLFQANAVTRSEVRSELRYDVDEKRDKVFYIDITGGVDQQKKELQEQAKESAKARRATFEALGITEPEDDE